MEYENFGKKTFIFFVLRRSGPFFGCLVIFLTLLALNNAIPYSIQSYVQIVDFFFVIGILALAVGTIGISFLEYHNFTISIYDRNVKITKGIINRYEIGVPHRAVDRVDITRSLISRFFGMSDIVIYVSSDDDQKTPNQKIVLPFIEKNLAAKIQQEILHHSQAQHFKDADVFKKTTL